MTPTTLVFLKNEAGEEEGLADAGIETYRDNPYGAIARECGQNSRDVPTALPVELRFNLKHIPIAEYPLYSDQLDAIRRCLSKAKKMNGEKEIEFFSRAEEVLLQNKIPILTVEDHNTKGLTGPSEPGTPFHTLVKSSGVSSKDSDTSGGSFGIGKFAAFAASELQTVFYSTVYLDGGKPAFLAQGKTILMSHTGPDGVERRKAGYWGMPMFMPIGDLNMVPSWLRRTSVGTSVVVAGFRAAPDWQYRIAASLLQNFFCGIHRDELRFLINDGEICINKSTIESHFGGALINQAAEDADGGEEFRVAKELYECLISKDADERILNIPGMGPVRLMTLMRDGFHKRVQIIRNGMSITDELGHFGDKFQSFPMYKDFVALVEPADQAGNKLIKRLENPRHDELSAERISDPQKRLEAIKAMKKLAKEIRQAIRAQALKKAEDKVDLDELSEYFDAQDPGDAPPSPTDEENPEHLIYKAVTPRPRPRAGAGSPGDAGGGGGSRGGRGGGSGAGPRSGGGIGGGGKKGADAALRLQDIRNITLQTTSNVKRRLFFTPLESGNAVLEIRAPGIDTPAALYISTADKGAISNGRLEIGLQDGVRTAVDIEFTEPFQGPIEIVATKSERQ